MSNCKVIQIKKEYHVLRLCHANKRLPILEEYDVSAHIKLEGIKTYELVVVLSFLYISLAFFE